MAVAHAVPFIDEIEVGVYVQDVDRTASLESLDHWCVDGVVAAEHDRHGALFEELAHRILDVGVALGLIRMDDVGVTHVNHPYLVFGEIHGVVFVIVGTGVPEREQRRRFADAPGAEARTWAPLCAHVVRRTEYCNVGINVIPVGAGA